MENPYLAGGILGGLSQDERTVLWVIQEYTLIHTLKKEGESLAIA